MILYMHDASVRMRTQSSKVFWLYCKYIFKHLFFLADYQTDSQGTRSQRLDEYSDSFSSSRQTSPGVDKLLDIFDPDILDKSFSDDFFSDSLSWTDYADPGKLSNKLFAPPGAKSPTSRNWKWTPTRLSQTVRWRCLSSMTRRRDAERRRKRGWDWWGQELLLPGGKINGKLPSLLLRSLLLRFAFKYSS